MKYITTITESDVGNLHVRDQDGNLVWLADAIGRVYPVDVGKRVYSNNGVIQVENDEQRDKRLGG